MTNFTVGPTPLQVIGQGVNNAPLTVQNTGAVSVYISADPGVNPNFYAYKIDAGGDFIWPNGTPLSVCTGPGVKGQISYGGNGEVHVNSGSTNVTGAVSINGTVPISGPVTVSGTVGISGGSINLNAPVSITGGVSVTGSTINVGTVRNSVDQLASWNTVIPISTQQIIYDSGPTGILNYQTLIIMAAAQNVGATTAVTSIFVQWWDSAKTFIVGTDAPIMYSNGLIEYQIPIRGTRCVVSLVTSANGTHNALPVQVYGSVYLLPRRYYSTPANSGQLSNLTLFDFQDFSIAGHYGIDAQPATNATVIFFIPNLSGPANLFLQSTTVNNTGIAILSLARNGSASSPSFLYNKTTNTVALPSNDSIVFPEAPTIINLGSTSASRLQLGLTWTLK